MSERPIIEAYGLHSYYGTSHILHGIDFSVRAGEAVGLIPISPYGRI
jgi:branched-chain amino acid transport system ATP-binding protein